MAVRSQPSQPLPFPSAASHDAVEAPQPPGGAPKAPEGPREGAEEPQLGAAIMEPLSHQVDLMLGVLDWALERASPSDGKRRKLQDPAQVHCSAGRLAFLLLFCWALAALAIGAAEEDGWEILGALFVMGFTLYATVFLGGDPCMMDAFRRVVNRFASEVSSLRRKNDRLEAQLGELAHVQEGLEDVRRQLGGSADATTALLKEMERFYALQTGATVMDAFLAADFDANGRLNGEEAAVFVPHLEALWQLVPAFDTSRLAAHIRVRGLSRAELAGLINALIVGDPGACQRELEDLCCGGGESGPLGPGAEAAPSPAAPAPAGGDGEAPPRPPAALAPEGAHATAPPDPELGLGAGGAPEEEGEALAPWFSLGPVGLGSYALGPFAVWGPLHFALLLTTPLSVLIVVTALLVLEVTNMVTAFIGVALSFGLAAAGRLLEVLRVLREQVKRLSEENERLEASTQRLEASVVQLSRLQRGFEQLQSRCQGNVEVARELIGRNNANVKVQAMTVVLRLFRRHDLNSNGSIDEREADEFVRSLQAAFQSVPDFDAPQIRRDILEHGLRADQVKRIVDEEDRAFESRRASLVARKRQAAAEEDFDAAAEAKESLAALARREVERLQRKKAKAVEEEDYAEAKRVSVRLAKVQG